MHVCFVIFCCFCFVSFFFSTIFWCFSSEVGANWPTLAQRGEHEMYRLVFGSPNSEGRVCYQGSTKCQWRTHRRFPEDCQKGWSEIEFFFVVSRWFLWASDSSSKPREKGIDRIELCRESAQRTLPTIGWLEVVGVGSSKSQVTDENNISTWWKAWLHKDLYTVFFLWFCFESCSVNRTGIMSCHAQYQ